MISFNIFPVIFPWSFLESSTFNRLSARLSFRLGPVHVVTEHNVLINGLGIRKSARRLFHGDDVRYDIRPIALLNKLARNGFHVVAQTRGSVLSNNKLYWTCKKEYDFGATSVQS